MNDDVEDLMLQLSRILPAPPDAVFAACVEPEELRRWWGPKGFTSPGVELDVRVGGKYRIAMQPPDGEVFFLSGEFREVRPPSRLAFTFVWEPADVDDVETVAVLDLEDLDGRTRLDLRQGAFATGARRDLHEGGWTDSLDRLEELLVTRRDGA